MLTIHDYLHEKLWPQNLHVLGGEVVMIKQSTHVHAAVGPLHSHLHAVRLNNNMASNLSNLGVNPPLPPYILKGGCQALPFIIPDL